MDAAAPPWTSPARGSARPQAQDCKSGEQRLVQALASMDAKVFPGGLPRKGEAPFHHALRNAYLLQRRVASDQGVVFYVYNVPLWHLHAIGAVMESVEPAILKVLPCLEEHTRGLCYMMRVVLAAGGAPMDNVALVNAAFRRACQLRRASMEEVILAVHRAAEEDGSGAQHGR